MNENWQTCTYIAEQKHLYRTEKLCHFQKEDNACSVNRVSTIIMFHALWLVTSQFLVPRINHVSLYVGLISLIIGKAILNILNFKFSRMENIFFFIM